MLTMGGIPGDYPFVQQLTQQQPSLVFVIPGGAPAIERHGNVILLPHQSAFYHPDLIHASDVVIGKVGYSTIAEIFAAGVPFGYITRPNFRESAALVTYIRRELQGIAIAEADFYQGAWLQHLPDLLALPRLARHGVNGAAQIARFVYDLM